MSRKHTWTADVRNRQPVMRCANTSCPVVWWPDRLEPRSMCRGVPVEQQAAETVKALIIGGAV